MTDKEMSVLAKVSFLKEACGQIAKGIIRELSLDVLSRHFFGGARTKRPLLVLNTRIEINS